MFGAMKEAFVFGAIPLYLRCWEGALSLDVGIDVEQEDDASVED